MRRSTRGSTVVVALCALVLVAAGDVPAPTDEQAANLAIPCDDPFEPTGETVPTDVIATDIEVTTADGSTVTGCLVHPAGDAPVVDLVVFAHGQGHTVQNAWRRHMWEVAGHGAATIAVNFRDNFAFPTHQGAEDVIASTHWALERFPDVERTILFGVSMGGAVSGTALVKSADLPAGLYDLWFDVEGVSMVWETWAEARAAEPAIADGIERDMGGTPLEVPDRYIDGSPAMNADAMAAAGLQGAVLVHAPFDGRVAYWQGREMALALDGAGIPYEFHTVVQGNGSEAGSDSTPLKLVPGVGSDLEDVSDQTVGLAGHASERDPNHPVMRTALDRLVAILDGAALAPSESIADLAGPDDEPSEGEPSEPSEPSEPTAPTEGDGDSTSVGRSDEPTLPATGGGLGALALAALGAATVGRGRRRA